MKDRNDLIKMYNDWCNSVGNDDEDYETWVERKLLETLQSKGKTKEEVFFEQAHKLMNEFNHNEFPKSFPTLFKTILSAMEEYAQSHANKDGWVRVEGTIKSRIQWFEKHHHSFEANELKSALSSIERLVPPSMYKHEPLPPKPQI